MDVPTKFQLDNNVFLFCCAPDDSYSRPIEELQKLDVNVLMTEIKQKLFERSSFGVKHLGRIFKAMDQKGDFKLDADDFRWGLLDFGVQITKEEAQEVLSRFDTDHSGSVNFKEFLTAIRVSNLIL